MAAPERLNPWLEAARLAMMSLAEPVPAGFLRREEVFKFLGTSTTHGRKQLMNMIAAGMVEKKPFRVLTRGGIKRIPHYRLVQKQPGRGPSRPAAG